MLGGIAKLIGLALLAVPILIVVALFQGLGSWNLLAQPAATPNSSPAGQTLIVAKDDTVTVPPRPVGVSDQAPPPTLGPAPAAATLVVAAAPTAAPTAVLEKVVIGNTGGIGAAVRDTPKGKQIAGLRDGQVVDVLDRQQVGTTTWIKVHVKDGVDGWILGVVGLPTTASSQAAPAATPLPAAQPAPTAASAPAAATTSGTGRTHTVLRGESLKDIAASYGVSMASIMTINVIPNPDSLTVGQVLQIPDAPQPQ